MRVSPIRDLLAQRGATFGESSGVEHVRRFSSFEEEYRGVREAVGLTDFSFTQRYQIPEAGLDLFDRYAAGAVANIRFGRVLHTMAVDNGGWLESDLYIANDDEQLILIGESLVDDTATSAVLRGLGEEACELEDLSSSTCLFGLDGVNAWAVVKDLLGPDVLGLPYLSIESYPQGGTEVKLIRGGKTSEFGYLLMVPAEHGAALWERIEVAGQPHGLVRVGLDTHMTLRLDGRFFNIHEEGRSVRDPLPLGLQWMMELDGEDYRGKEALMARRGQGVEKKIIGVISHSSSVPLEVGEKVLHGGDVVGELKVAKFSPALDNWVGLALFSRDFAFANLDFIGERGRGISTISMPPITPKSLAIRLDEM
jgi:glycine cleavage system aminomethyltransferase T